MEEMTELNGIGKRLGTEAKFLEVKCCKSFIDKVKQDYGLLVEYDMNKMTIHYSDGHRETEARINIENDNLCMFLLAQKQESGMFYGVVPYWWIRQNYTLNN